MSRYDDFDHLTQELEMEKRYREGVEDANVNLEKTIADLEGYLRHIDDQCQQVDENEWKVRYEAQTALNIHLSDEKGWLEAELAESRWKCHTGAYPDAMNFNLDLLTELELLRLVKHMERMRSDCYTTLRETEYKIDKEAKEFHQFDEMRRTYRADLKHAMQTVERIEMEKIIERRTGAATPPLYSQPYTEWLDSQPLEEDSKDPKSTNDRSMSKDGEGKNSKKNDETEDHTTSGKGEPGEGETREGDGDAEKDVERPVDGETPDDSSKIDGENN